MGAQMVKEVASKTSDVAGDAGQEGSIASLMLTTEAVISQMPEKHQNAAI